MYTHLVVHRDERGSGSMSRSIACACCLAALASRLLSGLTSLVFLAKLLTGPPYMRSAAGSRGAQAVGEDLL